VIRFGPLTEKTRPGVRRALGKTDHQLAAIVTWATEQGFVSESDEGHWALTEAGVNLGTDTLEAVEETTLRTRTWYRPYAEYVPMTWLTPE
jgi:hypothetical protein